MKRNIVITFFITLLLLGAGVFVSQHDSVRYKNVMNRNGVSEDAIILKTNSSKTIVDALKDLQNHDKLNFRIHFIDKKNPNQSYFYSQNERLNLPIENGRNFSSLDFSASVPFVIAGKNVKNIIKPQEQSYLLQDESYLPVIGSVEMSGKSNLNDHIFVSISPQMTDNFDKIKNYQVILDGVYTHKEKTIKVVKKAVNSHKTTTTTNKINNVKQSVIERNGTEFAVLAAITVIIVILNFNLIVPMKYSINNSQLDGDLQKDFKVGFIFLFALYNLVAFGIAYFAIHSWILIINHTPMNMFFIVNIVCTILLGGYVIFTNNRRFIH